LKELYLDLASRAICLSDFKNRSTDILDFDQQLLDFLAEINTSRVILVRFLATGGVPGLF